MYDKVEETLLILPNSKVRLSLLVRTDEETFRENTLNNGDHSLRVMTSDYLVISYRDREAYASVSVSYFCMEIFRQGLRECLKFIQDSIIDDGTSYKIDPKFAPGFKIENLCNNRSILFTPFIDTNEDGSQNPGVTIWFTEELSSFVSYNDFESLVNICLRFDLYMASKLLLNNAMLYEMMKPKD